MLSRGQIFKFNTQVVYSSLRGPQKGNRKITRFISKKRNGLFIFLNFEEKFVRFFDLEKNCLFDVISYSRNEKDEIYLEPVEQTEQGIKKFADRIY